MTEFTPGPWKWSKDWTKVANRGEEITVKYASLCLFGGDGREIIPLRVDHYNIMYDGYVADFKEADRRLIAAAPDLLSALGMLVKMIEDDDWTTVELDEAREAIAKAEGRDEG